MKRFLISALAVVFAIVVYMGAAPVEVQAIEFATIGTGGITGVYYPTGGAIAKMINKKKDQYGIRCTVESTGGSVFNINAVMAGDLEFGICQSDRQYQAVNGLAEWKKLGKQEDLRACFAIHPEGINLVAGVDAGIKTLDDLKGKRVNIGNPGSGQRNNAIVALKAGGIDYKTDIDAESVVADEAPSLLQDERIDAYFYTVGHPNGNFKEATAGKRKVRFVPLTGPGIDKLVSEKPYFAKSLIPVTKYYPQAANDGPVESFGVKATFVTSKKISEDMVYAVTKEVFDNLEKFKKLHPAYAGLTKENMLEGLSAPLHRGALKYFKEVGLK